jgi:hypothetical protein
VRGHFFYLYPKINILVCVLFSDKIVEDQPGMISIDMKLDKQLGVEFIYKINVPNHNESLLIATE